MNTIDEKVCEGNGNEFIKNQNEFKWEDVKFPALVKSINSGVMKVAYSIGIDKDCKTLFGGYHCSYQKDIVGLPSNFILIGEITEQEIKENK